MWASRLGHFGKTRQGAAVDTHWGFTVPLQVFTSCYWWEELSTHGRKHERRLRKLTEYWRKTVETQEKNVSSLVQIKADPRWGAGGILWG